MIDNNTSAIRYFTSESCHEVGYGWTIQAPSDICPTQVELLQAALIKYGDHPCPSTLSAVLDDTEYCSQSGLTDIEALRRITITTQIVFRQTYIQNFQEESR